MRINVYSQEIIPEVDCGVSPSNTGVLYSYVRMFFHSSDKLHHPPQDNDRSAITLWLPKSQDRRDALAEALENMAVMVRHAPPETGLD